MDLAHLAAAIRLDSINCRSGFPDKVFEAG
jgi:hypothetical protein